MEMKVDKQIDLPTRWTYLDGKKGTILTDAEEYALWTLPYVFPRTGDTTEMQLSHDSIGAQAVNHLSNKVVSTLFPAQRMFFRLTVEQQLKDKAEAAMIVSGAPSAATAQGEVSKAMADVETSLASAEKRVQDYMDIVTYRPQAVNAAKLLIITGNALEYHPKDRPVQIYNLRDYCVLRDLSGEVIEIMTRESKSFETFKPEVQEKLRDKKLIRAKSASEKVYEDSSEVVIYTQIKLNDDGKYHVYQSADDVPLDTVDAFFTKDKLPWIPLTWNLIRGEDYGRGLVADYSGAFHAVNTLTGSLLNIAAVMGDIKFLVNPSSMVDIAEMNRSPAGSFHPGKKDDITAVTVEKLADAQFIATIIERYERQIAQAFLLNSSLTRDAERVTAEEIRAQANELETSNGGIYSRLAATWQQQLANVLLDQTNFKGLGDGFVPKIVTGMDSLSRAGELDNIRLFLLDIAMLNNVPEDFRVYIDKPAFAKVVGTNRQIDWQQFVKSNEQVQAEQQQAMEQQQALIAAQGDQDAKAAASKEAMKG